MIEFFEAMQFWHWILLAIVLIAGEALGAAGFLLGAVMASRISPHYLHLA